MSFPWGRTRAEAPLRPGHMLVAALAGWLGPMVLGALCFAAGGVAAYVDGGFVQTLGFILIYVPLFSWVGLLPGIALHWFAWRKGAGGLLTCLLIALVLGLLLANLVGPLAWIMAVPVSAIYWFVLRWLSPDSFVPAG